MANISTTEGLILDAPSVTSQYEVKCLLGEGGMGRVFRAEHRITGQQVAIKVLRSELVADEVFRARFVLEARALSRLDHPSITQLYNFVEEKDGRLFLIMQYVAGLALDDLLLKVGPLPAAVGMTLMHHVLDAFGYAHEQGVVHRDIKPGNIVLPVGGGVKVMDFGIARVESGVKLTTTGSSLGSPGYMSPEQVVGREVDARADIYALGVMLYEMLVGDLPFPGDNGYTVMKAHVEQPAPDPRDKVSMPDAIAEAILWALKKDPNDRPRTAAELADALPTAEELGGTEAASWAFLHKDHRAAVEVTEVTVPGTGRPPRLPPRVARGRVATGVSESGSAASPVETMNAPVPLHRTKDMPRTSRLPALLSVVGFMVIVVAAGGLFLAKRQGKPVSGPVLSPGLRVSEPLMVKGGEMVRVPGNAAAPDFFLDRTEVTYRQFRSFMDTCPLGSACGPKTPLPAFQLNEGELVKLLDHPVGQVTWFDAEAYCRQLGKRLPSSDEWTRAASGPELRKFPWGNQVAESRAWIAAPVAEVKKRPGQLPSVSVHDPIYYGDTSAYDVMGLGGNLSEWLADADPGDPSMRLVAGGSWATYDVEGEAKAADRLSRSPSVPSSSIGFRCAVDAEQARKLGTPTRLADIQRAGVLRVGAEEESPPMLFKTPGGKQTGFEYAIMQELAAALKARLELSPAMYPDLPSKLRSKRIDIILSAYTPDNSIRGVQWSASYLEYGLCLVVRKDSPIHSLKDLEGKRVAHYADPATARTVAELVPKAKQLFPYENRYMEDIRDGKLDAMLYDFPFVAAEIQPFLEELRIAQFGLTSATYNVGVPEGEWSMTRAINLALQEMVGSPRYVELLRDYLGGIPPVTDIPPGARTTIVQKGETLATIAKRELGDEKKWVELWELNRSRLGNQNLLYVGVPLVLDVPGAPEASPEVSPAP